MYSRKCSAKAVPRIAELRGSEKRPMTTVLFPKVAAQRGYTRFCHIAALR
jgi:hypothetical protein